MLTVIIFILILGLLVFVHELGHFVIARRNGVEAQEFGFGFPPRVFGLYRDKSKRYKVVWGSKDVESSGTIYSVNAIPLGGFVKITGEDGEEKENPKSFSSKSPFTRIRILAAGVIMNFLLAAVLFSLSFASGVPQPVEEAPADSLQEPKIQIIELIEGSPADIMGVRMGDEIIGAKEGGILISFSSVEDVQKYVAEKKGKEIFLSLRRGTEELELSGAPRENFPEGEGPLGISLAKIVVVKYAWYQAIVMGFQYTFSLTLTLITFLGSLVWRLIAGQPASLDVSGPVGIAVLTGQVVQLGFNYLVRFTAILSVNLAIINALPIPALDGGRILFTLIEKLKKSPVSQRFEQRAHSLGFALLITLMVAVTVRDFLKFDILEKIKNLL